MMPSAADSEAIDGGGAKGTAARVPATAPRLPDLSSWSLPPLMANVSDNAQRARKWFSRRLTLLPEMIGTGWMRYALPKRSLLTSADCQFARRNVVSDVVLARIVCCRRRHCSVPDFTNSPNFFPSVAPRSSFAEHLALRAEPFSPRPRQ